MNEAFREINQTDQVDEITQPPLFLDDASVERSRQRSSTFIDNLKLPIHSWYRFPAGFSALWVRNLLANQAREGKKTVLDPFAGSGTVLLEAEYCGYHSAGVEAHAFISKVAQAKLQWREDPRMFLENALEILKEAKSKPVDISTPSELVRKCYDEGKFRRLASLIEAWRRRADDSPLHELTWLAIISIIRASSSAGTAQWQYQLPRKQKKLVVDPWEAFSSRAHAMSADMSKRQSQPQGPRATITLDDARECASITDSWADLIVTSPPYVNNYDYADATRLELTVLGEVERWRDLHEVIRKYLIPSCTQHVTRFRSQTHEILNSPLLTPIEQEIKRVCENLEEVSREHKGQKAYHTLVAAYFKDMARVWKELRRVTKDSGLVCFVIGDSAPYGVHVPVDDWLGRLAVAAGFESYKFEKLRARNVKWKNRKHRVPLHEGHLWVQG